MKKLRILALVHKHLVPPDDTTGIDTVNAEWKMEFDVTATLKQCGHDVTIVGVYDDLSTIRTSIESCRPDVVFNLLEGFADINTYDQNVVSFLELLRTPYTGCNPRGLILARDKSLTKKLLTYHRVPVPDCTVVRRGRAMRSKRLRFPLIVKSLVFEASIGISQASVVENAEQLARRVQFVHESIGTAAIVEEFIDGRELYVGVIGNERPKAFPVWEMSFAKMPERTWHVATERVKWNTKYQKTHGIMTDQAVLPDSVAAKVQHTAARVYRALDLNGYARIDFRMDVDGRLFVLEANPNPQLALGEDFAASAERAGVPYPRLLERIVSLGRQWRAERVH